MELELSTSEVPVVTEHLDHFPTIDSNSTTYEEFFKNYLSKNQACLIKNVSNDWNCTKTWLVNKLPNLEVLEEKYGHFGVYVYDCKEKYYNSQPIRGCKFKKYLEYWKEFQSKGYPKDMPLDYVKDWHLKLSVPSDKFYETPIYFRSDWLNEYLIENRMDDYRFVYMGPKGTWTPFHSDVFSSYSWSVNVAGKKKWTIFPPGEEEQLKDNLNNLPFDLTTVNLTCKCFEVIQEADEAMFVPSNWYHQVVNLEDTISINHNWINGCNIRAVYNALEAAFVDVKKEIRDCSHDEAYLNYSQTLLKASFGMNFKDFYLFIAYIAQKRIDVLNNLGKEHFDGIILGKNHAMFDLKNILEMLDRFQKHSDLQLLKQTSQDVSSLYNKIKEICCFYSFASL